MKESSRARRMQRHHERRNNKNASLNMVSLMDIFTILVFFLLVSAANSDILPTPKNIKLPLSTAQALPKENLVIIVGEKDILLQGKKVAEVPSVVKSSQNIILPLMDGLKDQLRSKPSSNAKELVKSGVTIMGDKEIPYIVLKKLMMTCAASNFTDISLAVNKKAVDKG